MFELYHFNVGALLGQCILYRLNLTSGEHHLLTSVLRAKFCKDSNSPNFGTRLQQ